jgi:hypothetical protein
MPPIIAMHALTRNAKSIPLTKSSAATVMLEASPEKSPEMPPAPATVAIMAPIIARLVACPEQRIVAKVPDAIPSFLLSTEPITALVFGLAKMPTPIPINRRPISTRQRNQPQRANRTMRATMNIP